MKIIISLVLLSLSCQISHGQSPGCATMEVLKQKMEQDPQLRQRRDSIEIVRQSQIGQMGVTEDYSQLNLPPIPGFVPTGNPQEDSRNFAHAKQELFARDPERYRQLTRHPNSTNRTKTKR